MAKIKTIAVGFQSFKIIKELENTIIVEKDDKRYLYHKKKKIIITPNYDAKKITKAPETKASKGRAKNDSYTLEKHKDLAERVQKVMDRRSGCYRFEIAREIGFSPTRTLGNYFAKSSSYSSNALTIIFVCSMIGAALTGYYGVVLGVSVSILFSYAFTQLLTEVGYLLYLKTKSKEYWEDEPEDNPTLWDLLWNWLKGFSLKKVKLRIPLEIVCYLLMFVALDHLGYADAKVRRPIWLVWIVRMITLGIALDFFISMARAIIRKFSNKRQGKK